MNSALQLSLLQMWLYVQQPVFLHPHSSDNRTMETSSLLSSLMIEFK